MIDPLRAVPQAPDASARTAPQRLPDATGPLRPAVVPAPDGWSGRSSGSDFTYAQGVVVMEMGDPTIEYQPGDVAREDDILPGSFVTGSPARFANPEQMIDALGQSDALAITDGDPMRCGAACLLASAILEGPQAVQRLYATLLSSRHVPEYLKAELRDALNHLDPSAGMTKRLAHLMQEALFQGLKAAEGTSGNGGGLRIATLASAAQALLGAEGEGSGAKPQLRPGERHVVLLGAQRGQNVGHYVVIGRDARGRHYCYDPSRASPGGGHAIRHFPNAQRMWQVICRERPFVWSMRAQRPVGAPSA